MKASLYKIQLPLTAVIRLADHFLNQRTIGILKLEEGDQIGYGEVSPLPFFNSETFEDVQNLDDFNIPSLNWALECAKKNMTLNRPEQSANLSGLILEDEKSYLYKAVEYEKLCYKSIKLKVGSDLKKDLVKIQNIIKGTSEIKLRLDFNGRANTGGFTSLELFLKELSRDRIEYIEDPLPNDELSQYESLYELTKIPYAIDYQNQKVSSNLTSNLNGLAAFIIKPMRVTISKVLELKVLSPKLILSSSFESSLGLSQIVQFANEIESTVLSHGLDTSHFFKENIFDLKKYLNKILIPADDEIKNHMTRLTNTLLPIKVVDL